MTGDQKPSVYVPFTRRFTNERERELRETEALYADVEARQNVLPETLLEFAGRFYPLVWRFPDSAEDAALRVLWDLLASEEQIWSLPAPTIHHMTMREYVEYRNLLYAKQHFFANQATHLARLEEGVRRVLGGIGDNLPDLAAPAPFTVPLVNTLSSPRGTIDAILRTLAEYYDEGLFRTLTDRLYRNVCGASGRDPDDPNSRKPIIPATKSDLPLGDLCRVYLGDTAFERLFAVPVPLKLTHEDRFNHMHVVGGSGSGKTTLIENLIRHDLASEDPPTIVLIDPHSDLVRKLVRSDLGIEERLVLIDPRDTAHPLALNPFALNRDRLGTYDEATREQVTAGVIQTFGYLWSGLTNLTLTGKQEVLFRYVTRLMLSLPQVEGRNATILDMLKLMGDPAPYAAAIEALPDIPRDFFKHDFASKSFEGTREQIRYRLQAIIENPTMARLFTAPETKIDFFTELNRGAVILVDTAKDFLKEGSGIFGKLIVSLILQAIMERAAIPERARKATFVMIDEAGSFFSSNIDDLLTEARKYKAGLVLAHQYLDQATSSLRASLAANTGIKFASGLSAQDAGAMARDMRTTPDFILSQPKLQFAAHIRNVTSSAVSIPITFVQDAPQLSSSHFEQLIDRNRARVSVSRSTVPKDNPTVDVPPTSPDEDISKEW